jgi:hypothetical protein
MNDNDLNLIVDLIESQLGTTDAGSALARIVADPELLEAYTEQLAVHDSLKSLPIASMTADEKEALNTALVTQLRLEDEAVVVPVTRKRAPWWMPVAGIAAAAAAVTAIFIVPNMSGSDDSGADTTVVASAAQRAPEESAADGESFDSGVEEQELAATDSGVTVVELSGADLVEVLNATVGESSPEVVQDRLSTLGYTDFADVSQDVLAECISQMSSQLPPDTTGLVLFGVDTSGPTDVAHIGLVFDDGIGAAMSVDLETCDVLGAGN